MKLPGRNLGRADLPVRPNFRPAQRRDSLPRAEVRTR